MLSVMAEYTLTEEDAIGALVAAIEKDIVKDSMK